MIAQKEAVTRLLKDGDPDTVRLVKEQLLLHGEDNLRDIQSLASVSDACVSRHLRDVLDELHRRDHEEDFDLFCRFFSDCSDVEPGLWLLASALDPRGDLESCKFKVEQWGRRLAVRLANAVSSRERVLALSDFMSGELCFRGNADDYYCERNSILSQVIDIRAGIPITLTLLYRMVALRAGMLVDGINLPGHFIARHEDVYFDPFHKGRILTHSDCEKILLRQNLRLKSCHLLPATPRQILLRVLANLLYVFELHDNRRQHEKIATWMQALCGEPIEG
jgi:regulator of sirC expression with transglutaminase-like and TPR domain